MARRAGSTRAGRRLARNGCSRTGRPRTTRPALFTALRTGFADQLLREAFAATRALRAARRHERDLPPGAPARGLGKLLVVAPDQVNARRYAAVLRGWVPASQSDTVQLAISDELDAPETLARFRLTPEPSGGLRFPRARHRT